MIYALPGLLLFWSLDTNFLAIFMNFGYWIFDNIYWIAGGVAKEGGIEPLKEFFPKIKHAYLIGQAADEFSTTLNGYVDFTKCDNLEAAFMAAKKDAENNSKDSPAVLLSPACASFDQWPNFEARGEAFCKMV